METRQSSFEESSADITISGGQLTRRIVYDTDGSIREQYEGMKIEFSPKFLAQFGGEIPREIQLNSVGEITEVWSI